MNKEFFKNKKFKYGTAATVLTVVVIALVILANTAISSLASAFNLYTDLTGTSVYSVSDKFTEKLNGLVNPENGEKKYFSIVLMMEEDEFESYSYYTRLVYYTAKQIISKFDNASLVCRNITRYPEYKTRYQLNDADPIYITDVVIEMTDKDGNPTDGSYKRYDLMNFFSYTTDSSTGEQSIYAYNAEVAFLSAVDRLVNYSERPTAYYLTGHGEPSLAETEWASFLDIAGYDSKEINLAYEDFPYSGVGEANSDLLIVNCPVYDLLAPTEEDTSIVSEAKKIRLFLSNNYGNMIVTEDSSCPSLPALEQLLSEWALGFGKSVSDDSHSISSSGTQKITVDYSANTNAVASSFLSRLLSGGTTPVTIFTNPKAVTIGKNDDISHPTNIGTHSVQPLFVSYDTAVSDSVRGVTPMAGFSLIEWTKETSARSYVFCFGSSDFLNPTYNMNRSVMYAVLALINSNESVNYEEIDPKLFDNEKLTVSTSQATAWTVVLAVVIPVAVLGAGAFVWIRRRRS